MNSTAVDVYIPARVTPYQALQVLGLDSGADSGAIRRAYLAGVKRHRAETDPEGFKRVRQAFELLRDAARIVTELDAPVESRTIEVAPCSISLANGPHSAELRELLRGEPDLDRRLSLALEIAARTHEAGGYLSCADAVAAEVSEEAAASLLRAGIARGHAELVPILRSRHPDLLSREELAAWVEAVRIAPAENSETLAWALLDDAQPQLAAELLLRLTHPDVPTEERPSPGVLIRFIAHMIEDGALSAAVPTFAAFEAAYSEAELGGLDPQTAVAYQGLRQLLPIGSRIYAPLVRAIAHDLVAASHHDVVSAAQRLANRHVKHAKYVLLLIRTSAPALFELYGPVLARAIEQRPSLMGEISFVLLILAVIVGFGIRQAVIEGAFDSPPSEYHAAYARTAEPIATLCLRDRDRSLCKAALAWRETMRASCEGVPEALEAVRRDLAQVATQGPLLPSETRAFETLQLFTRTACKAHTGSAANAKAPL